MTRSEYLCDLADLTRPTFERKVMRAFIRNDQPTKAPPEQSLGKTVAILGARKREIRESRSRDRSDRSDRSERISKALVLNAIVTHNIAVHVT